MVELSDVLTLSICGGFVIILIIAGIIVYRGIIQTKTKVKQNEYNLLLFNLFSSHVCAKEAENNSEEQIQNIEPHLNAQINGEFTTRKCSYND